MLIRLNKFIAECGVCSRRKADELILKNKVKINDVIVNDLGTKVDDKKDVVKVSGKVIKKEEERVYLMLNKPKGYITTSSDELGRKSVLDLINEDVRVFSIGRLDKDTEGLLLLTNDGEFANQLMHPRNVVEKTYIVTTDSKITPEKIEKLKKGIDIGGYITKEAKVRLYSKDKLEIVITEGKNRQVRKMCEAVDIVVKKLKRVKIGEVLLENLKQGEYRKLTKKEIKKLKNV